MTKNEKETWLKVLIVILVVVIGMVTLVSLFGYGFGGTGMMGGGMMGFGWLFMILPIIFVILLVFALSNHNTPECEHQYYGPDSALKTLDRRYATGEISREEYLRIREDLGPKNIAND